MNEHTAFFMLPGLFLNSGAAHYIAEALKENTDVRSMDLHSILFPACLEPFPFHLGTFHLERSLLMVTVPCFWFFSPLDATGSLKSPNPNCHALLLAFNYGLNIPTEAALQHFGQMGACWELSPTQQDGFGVDPPPTNHT